MAAIDVLAEECSAFQWHFFTVQDFILVIGCGLIITLPQKSSTPLYRPN